MTISQGLVVLVMTNSSLSSSRRQAERLSAVNYCASVAPEVLMSDIFRHEGGDVNSIAAWSLSITRAAAVESVLSPHESRCAPTSQRLPGREAA
jgi:hypothetical protein